MATTKKKADELPLTPAEEVPADAPSLGVQLNIIDNALKQYDPIEAGLNQLRAKYGGIKIVGVDDATGLELAKAGVKELTSTRTKLEAKRKELKADSLEYGRRVDAKAKEIQAAIEAIEKPIREEVARIEAEKEALKRAEETRRIGILTTAGFQLVGERYQVGTVGNYFDNIMEMDAKAFAEFATQGSLERERLDKEEADRKKQLEEYEAKQKEMQELEQKLAAMKAQLATPPARDFMDSGGDGSHLPKMTPMQQGMYDAEQATPSSAFSNPRTAHLPEQNADIWGLEPTHSPLPMSQYGAYSDGVLGTNYSGANPGNSTMPPAQAQANAAAHNAKQVWFNDGWEACKNRIIKVFTEDTTPRKRAEWVEIFQNLQP